MERLCAVPQYDCGKLKKVDGGAVAQLGARLDGIEEVVGSNPIGSTNIISKRVKRVEMLPATEPDLFTRNRVARACTGLGTLG